MTKNRFTSTFNFTKTKKVKTTKKKKTEKTTQQAEPRSPKKGLQRKQNQSSIYKKNTGMSIASVDDNCDRKLVVVSRKCSMCERNQCSDFNEVF